MKIRISATFEGKCSLCGEEAVVFTVGDEKTKKVVTLCKRCSEKLGEMQIPEVIEKYGKGDRDVFKKGVRVERKHLKGKTD